jgi:putative ABC transport system ATP-binding protein
MNILDYRDVPTSGGYRLEEVDIEGLLTIKLAEVRNKNLGFALKGFNILARTANVQNVELPRVNAGIPFLPGWRRPWQYRRK